MLNENQRKAVTSSSKYILCIASAGTGKTTVLSERVAYLSKQRISMNNMLALTFTRMAAKQMKNKIISKIGRDGKKIFCNTFHSFCIYLLREWGYFIDLKDYSIYSEEEKVRLIKNIIPDFAMEATSTNIKNVLEYIKNPEKHINMNYSFVAKEYAYTMKRNKALDLDMLLNAGLKLLKINEVYDWCHNKYQYVFIDEYQDVNSTQQDIIKAIDPENLFVVGDPNQCIYEWRGSKPEYILSFAKTYRNCEIIHLTKNYRSSKFILNAANNIIKDTAILPETDGPCDKVEYIVCKDERSEADKIASIIIGYKDRSYGDFTILARTNSILTKIEDQFKRDKIPCKIISKRNNFYKQYDAKILMGYLSVAINNNDDIAIRDIISEILTERQIAKLELKCIEKNRTMFQGLQTFKFKAQDEINKIIEKIEKIKSIIIQRQRTDALNAVNTASEILGIENGSGIRSIKEKIKKWINNKPGENDILAFLRYIKTMDTQDELLNEDADIVKLMTVHAAKGLEFPVVFIPEMNQGIFPSKRSPIDEERRLFYVAVTRAKEKLYITRPEIVIYNIPLKMQESQFIKDLNLRGDNNDGIGTYSKGPKIANAVKKETKGGFVTTGSKK